MDAIDLYQIHWPEPDADIEEGWATLAQAAGGRQSALDRRLQFQRGARWSAAGRSRRSRRCSRPIRPFRPEVEEETLPYCQQHGIGVIVYSPMKSGLLTGHDDQGARGRISRRTISGGARRPFRSRSLRAIWQLAELMRAIGARHGRIGRRSGHCLDAAASGGDGGDRRDALGRAGGRRASAPWSSA